MCGFLILFYSLIHTIFHMCGSMIKVSPSTDQELAALNVVLMEYTFHEWYSYAHNVFLSTPGWTGWVLWIILFAMGLTAIRAFRKRFYQIFSLTHFFGTPLFFIITCAHGSDSWFNWGFPLGLLAIPAACLILCIHYGTMIYDSFCRKFKIVEISVTEQ